MDNFLAIGVFDSGVGGLTVLRALRHILPAESFVYLGDMARLPYGTKSAATVQQYAVQVARLLVERQIKALVIACNTATTAALPHLQAIFPDIPVLGVVAPGAAVAVSSTRNRRILVWATETTIAAQSYQHLILEKLQNAAVSARACSLLVALAEEGMIDNDIAKATLAHYLSDFNEEDTILLGCTHFPVFKPLLKQMLPSDKQVVDSADATAQALHALLTKEHLLTDKTSGHIRYLVTDSVKRFQSVGEIFLGEPLSLTDIELVDASINIQQS